MHLHKLALLLVILGAIHLGLVAIAGVDVIGSVFGSVGHVVSVIIGASGLWLALTNYTTLLKKTA